MADIADIRKRIDELDDELLDLFSQRMTLSAEAAEYKRAHRLPIYDAAREQEIIACMKQKADSALQEEVPEFFSKLFELSRSYQEKLQ